MADDNDSKRGFANADKETRERVAKQGAAAQPKSAKAKGGHMSDSSSS